MILQINLIFTGCLTTGGAWAAEWPDMVGWQEHVRKYGVEQFIRLYNKLKVIDGLFTRSVL